MTLEELKAFLEKQLGLLNTKVDESLVKIKAQIIEALDKVALIEKSVGDGTDKDNKTLTDELAAVKSIAEKAAVDYAELAKNPALDTANRSFAMPAEKVSDTEGFEAVIKSMIESTTGETREAQHGLVMKHLSETPTAGAHMALKRFEDAGKDKMSIVGKALAAASSEGSGGLLLPVDIFPEITALLRDDNVIDSMNFQKIVIPNIHIRFNNQLTASTAIYAGENPDGVTSSVPTFNSDEAGLKKIIGLSEVSNDLLGVVPGFSKIITNDLRETSMSLREEKLMLGLGTQHTPKGFLIDIPASVTIASSGATGDATEKDMNGLAWAQIKAKHNAGKPYVYLMNPALFFVLKQLTNGAGGQYIYPGLREAIPNIEGRRVFMSNYVAVSDTNKSNWYRIFPKDIRVLSGPTMSLEFFKNGAYKDAEGGTHFGVDGDSSVFRLKDYNNILRKYDTSVGVIEDVDVSSITDQS